MPVPVLRMELVWGEAMRLCVAAEAPAAPDRGIQQLDRGLQLSRKSGRVAEGSLPFLRGKPREWVSLPRKGVWRRETA